MLFTLSILGFGWLILAVGGKVEWLGVLFLVLYLCYTAIMMYYAFVSHGFSLQMRELLRGSLGVCLIGFLSAITWNQQELRGTTIAIGLGSIAIFIIFSLRGALSMKMLFSKQPKQAGGP